MHLFHSIKRMSAAAVTCIVSTVILCGNLLSAQAYTFTPDKTLHSQAAILYNRDTEQVLYEKNPDQPCDSMKSNRSIPGLVIVQPYFGWCSTSSP